MYLTFLFTLSISSASLMNWIEMFETDSGISGRESPVHLAACGVAVRFPGRNLPRQVGQVWNALVQALPSQHAQFDLRHVQPTPVLGCVMQLQLLRQPPGLLRRKGFIQRAQGVGVQVVLHQDDPFGRRVVNVHQVLDDLRPVHPSAPLAHRGAAPTPQGFVAQEHVAHPVPLILVVLPCRTAWRRRLWRPGVGQQLGVDLVQADLREARVVGPLVDRKHILHVGHELAVGRRRQTPFLLQPRFKGVFLRVRRTVSWAIVSTTSSCTSRAPSSRKVQRACPAGGVLQASVTNCASCAPSSFRTYSRSGCLRCKAASRPCSTYRCRTRASVALPTSTATATAGSGKPGPSDPWSAFNKIRAWVNVRARAVPADSKRLSSSRSSVERVTIKYFMSKITLVPSFCNIILSVTYH